MEWPGVIPDESFTSYYPVVTHDLLPTILDVLNLTSNTPDWELDGQSIMDVLRSGGQLNESRKPIGFTYGGSGLSLAWMDMEWKLVDHSNTCEGDECDLALYNLNDDPRELIDLSSQYPERVESMKDDMHKWYKSVITSQLSDSKCIIDRIATYWEYVIIGGVAASILLCCCCFACCIAVRLGYLTCCAGVYCFKWLVKEINEEAMDVERQMSEHQQLVEV